MYSRAHLLIERDIENIKKEKPWGIEAVPLKDNNMFEISAKILGLNGSQWEGGVFRLHMKFDETYNYTAPEVCFHTIPFHPNGLLDQNMYSRAHLLIERDIENIKKEKPWGIEAVPLKDNNMFEISAKILGLNGSQWEGGVFRLYMKFDETYNYTAPEVCFHTIPFHPNVDMITGKPCIDFLNEPAMWKEAYTIGHVLKTIQNLLSEPDLDNAVNVEATEMLMYSPHSYKQVVHECVSASQRVEAGMDPHPRTEKVRFAPQRAEPPKAQTAKQVNNKVGRISFEDYHLTWSGIATSKTVDTEKNPLLEAIKDNPALESAHYGLPLEELQIQLNKQLEEHNTLMYGKFSNHPKKSESKEDRMEKVNQMRKIYLQPRTPKLLSKENTLAGGGPEEEPWEREVDDLVQWTSKLDGDNL